MGRLSSLGVALALLLLFSSTLLFESKLPETQAMILSRDNFANINNLTVVNGAWTTSSGVLSGSSDGEALAWTGDLSWQHYQATVNLRTVGSVGEACLVIRYNSPQNYYFFGLGSFGHKYSVARVVDGIYKELAYVGSASEIEADKWYTITGVAVSGSLQFYVDGVKVFDLVDDSHPFGAVGFRVWQNTMQASQLVVQSLGWSKTYSGTSSEYANSIIQIRDEGYVVGTRQGLIKTDATGNIEWNKNIKSNGDTYVIQTSDGGYALAGTNMSDPPPGVMPDLEFLLVKTDSAGNEQWRRTYRDHSNQYASCLVQTSDGGYAIAGDSYAAGPGTAWFVKTNSNGNMEWNKLYGTGEYTSFNSVVQTSDGGYALAGSNALPAGGMKPGAWLVKTGQTGNVQWSKTYGEIGSDNAYTVVQTSDGGYALATTKSITETNTDALIIKTSSIGDVEWSKTFGGANNDDILSVIQTIDGGYALAGSTSSYGSNAWNGWFIKTDPAGNVQWNKILSAMNNNDLRSTVQTSDGGYAVVGATSLPGNGGSVAWLLRIPQDSPPETFNDYDGLWHTADFSVGLFAVDDFTIISQTYYRVNDGAVKTVLGDGQPLISTEGANNKLEYWSVDSLGYEDLSHRVIDSIKLDKTAPTCSVVIDSGAASTSSNVVTLTSSASDLTSGVSLVRYSNDGVWDTEVWESFSASKMWSLTGGEGIKTVYYQAKDNAGLLSLIHSDSVILESPSTPTPTPTITLTPSPTPSSTSAPSPTPIPTASPTPSIAPILTPTSTPLITPSPSPTVTPTIKPTATPSPTPPSTPLPTVTPTQSGPSPSQTPTTTNIPPITETNSSPTPISIMPSATPLSTPVQSGIQTSSPLPDSQPTETPVYIYALAVLAIAIVSIAAIIFVRKNGGHMLHYTIN